MAIYQVNAESFDEVARTTFDAQGIGERRDLQRLLRDHIDVVVQDALVIAEEYGTWDDSRRRIDLLAIDRDANPVVIELKRGDGALSELQAIRYAAMVSTLTFEQAVAAYQHYLNERGRSQDAREQLLGFLGWDEESDDDFGQAVRLVLVAASFPKELTTSVLWLNDNGLDITCVRAQPYELHGQILVDVQQVIPLPEATEYQIRAREKARKERQDRVGGRDFTKFDVTVNGQTEFRLAKRQAMYRVVRALCDSGITPEQIHDVLSWRGTTLWRETDGVVGSEEFRERTLAAAREEGPAFEPRRWFADDNQLIVSGGRTYALTKMWGKGTEEGMSDLLERFPQPEIVVERSHDD